jgi:DNA-binding MarR family transcriptional regulator
MAGRPSSDHLAAWRPLPSRPEQAGLLTREPCEDDARDACAVPTPKASRRCAEAGGWTASEARTLRVLLARLVEAA